MAGHTTALTNYSSPIYIYIVTSICLLSFYSIVIISVADDVVKVEVWDVVDKGDQTSDFYNYFDEHKTEMMKCFCARKKEEIRW
jgi:hypothetical protein